MKDLTEFEYWKEIRESISSILEEEEVLTLEDYKEKEDDIQERVWELADGHQWVIYNAYNPDVIRISPNDGYFQENFGVDGWKDLDFSTIQNQVAFGALYADLMEELYSRHEELERAA